MTPDQFLGFADPLPEPMLLLTARGDILACNRAFREQGIFPISELRGQSLAAVVAEGAEEVAHYLRACSRNRQLVLGSLILRGSDGKHIACRAEGALLCQSSEGNEALLLLRLVLKESAIGQFTVLNERIADLDKEILRRRDAEQMAREEAERLRVTLHSIGDAVIVTDPEGHVVMMNAVAETLTAWTSEQAAGYPLETVFRIVNESSRELVENPALRALRDGVIVGLANHTILLAKDGREYPIDDSAAPIRCQPDEVIGAVLVFRDISEKKKAEAALRTSEGQLRRLADAMPQMVWAARPDGFVDYYNERWYDFTGFARDVFGQQNWESILHPDDRQRCNDIYHNCIKNGQPYQIEHRFLDRKTGGFRWFLGRAVPVKHEDGRTIRWFGTYTDIDDTKRSQHTSDFLADASGALAELDDPESTLHKVANIAVPTFADWCVVDLYEEGKLRRVAAMHTDVEKVKLAQELADRFPPRSTDIRGVSYVVRTGKPDLVTDIPEAMLSEAAYDAEHLALLRQLGLRSYLCVPILLRGKLRGVLSFVIAESGRRFDKSDLRVAQDLANRTAVAIENATLYRALQEEDRRKDEFLATLAHELRNPLAPIRTGLQLLGIAGDDSHVVRQTHTMMERQLGQMVHIIDDLLDVSRISQGKLSLRKERIELAAVVSSALETCGPILEQSSHTLTVTMPETPIFLEADKTRLGQVFCNLLNNAAKYTANGGHVSLTVKREQCDAVVLVKDTGFGIPAHMLLRIFEMFTQVDRPVEESQGGLGIGLTIAKRLVEMHGGSIEARSAGQGSGSEFVVRLPVADAQVIESVHPTREEGSYKETVTRRILVVDDNVDAANVLAMMLRVMGNEVATAHDGLQAVEAAPAFRPHLILMDIGMPKLNGHEACRRIREQPGGEDITLVALTGWGQNADKQRSREAGFNHHLVKPVEPAILSGLLSALDLQNFRS